MRVIKKTFGQDLKEKEEAFLKLSGEERLRMVCKVNDRLRQSGKKYELAGSRVTVIRNP